MRAAVFMGDRRIELTDAVVPTPGQGQVLLRVEACGVCGSDYHIFAGEMTRGVFPPVVIGHEIAARVEALGPGVTGLTKGQFCVVDPVLGCGVCEKCQEGLWNLCASPIIVGYKLPGGFEQFLVVPSGKVVPIAESVGAAGGVLCETLACVLRGYDRLGFVAGCSAMILGAGTVGLLWTDLMRCSPVSKLIVTEPIAFRRAKASVLGADAVIDPLASPLAQQVKRVAPQGVDFIIDATGIPQVVQEAIPLLAPGGTFMAFGVCPAGSSVTFDPSELFQKEARIIGSKMPPGTLHRSARLIESGRIHCQEIVTTTLPLSQTAEAIAGFNDSRDKHVKIAIDPWK